jgi:hypothetical protein
MTQELTANRIGGRAIGALFFTGFGAIWLLLGLYAKERLSPSTLSLLACGTAALAGGAFFLLRTARTLPRMPDDPAMARAFKWINILQWVAVGLVAFTFARFRMDAYVVSAITAIVGLHMFPLARVFRYPMHYVTGTALLGWAAASILFFPKDELQGSTALGTGLILWLSTMLTLALAMRAVRTPVTLNSVQ